MTKVFGLTLWGYQLGQGGWGCLILIIDGRGQSIDLIGVLKESFWQQDKEIKRAKLVFRSLLYK